MNEELDDLANDRTDEETINGLKRKSYRVKNRIESSVKNMLIRYFIWNASI